MWPFDGRRKRLQLLAQFQREHQGPVPLARPRKPFLRWSTLGLNAEELERGQVLASSAERLDATMATPGWQDVLEAKGYYQALYDRQCKNPGLSERDRFRAACEWAAVEGFFVELANRLSRGRKARQELQKVVKA